MIKRLIIILVALGVALTLLYLSTKLFNKRSIEESRVEQKQSETLKDAELEQNIKLIATNTINTLKKRDMLALAELAHNQEGIRFSPYAYVNKQQIVLSKKQLENAFNDNTVREWGFYDGTGKPMNLTFKEYYDGFVYNSDFANATEVLYNVHTQRGNTTNNVEEFYPQGKVVEYYLEGTNPEYGGMDWNSLRLVFMKEGSEWKLVGIIHDEWTI